MRTLTLLVAALSALTLSAPVAAAAPGTSTRAVAAPDPYVDAIAPANEVPVTDPANLFGPPDDRFATVSGRFGKFLVLDLGAGEDGVGDLEVRYHNPVGTLAQSMDVHFLDGSGRRLGQGQLTMIGAGTRVTTVTNPSTQPYRYLRILTGVQTARFDSMRAAAPASRTGLAADFPICFPAPTPGTGWDLVASGFDTCGRCEVAGAAGVSNGEWARYRCGAFPVGLDVVYNLYVPTPVSPAAPDPYIDAVAPANEVQVDAAVDLFGAPDGRFATVHGRQYSYLVLDLGAGEEGVGDLEVHYALQRYTDMAVLMDVHFLDRNGRRLGQGQLGMVGFDGAPGVTTVTAPSTKPYRYLKIHTGLHVVRFDAMRAAAVAP